MQYKVARSAMSFIAMEARNGSLESLGVTREDFNKLTSHSPWLGTDRNRMMLTLNSLLSSTMDVIGVPRFQKPAEYVAAGIALFVAPTNVQAACRFMENIPTAESLGRAIDRPDVVQSQQLFSLVVQLIGDPESSHAKHLFEKNTTIRIQNCGLYGDEENSLTKSKK